MKICNTCKIEKDLDFFGYNGRNFDKKHNDCEECRDLALKT